MPRGCTATTHSPASLRTAVGRMRTPSVERMATWGWLMTGAVTTVPYAPTLVIVKVPPLRSSPVRRLAAGLVGLRGHGLGQGAEAQVAGVA